MRKVESDFISEYKDLMFSKEREHKKVVEYYSHVRKRFKILLICGRILRVYCRSRVSRLFDTLLRDLEPFEQFTKREKHPWKSLTFSKTFRIFTFSKCNF